MGNVSDKLGKSNARRLGPGYRTESLLMVEQNNIIRTNYIKSKINRIASVDYVFIETKPFVTY